MRFSGEFCTEKYVMYTSAALKTGKNLGKVTLNCVIPVVCVNNEREENVVKQHN